MSDNMTAVQTRIKHKVDTVENWAKVEDKFTPLDGELIIYRGQTHNNSEETIHFKVGDNNTLLKNLPFAYDKELLELATAISDEAKTREEEYTQLSINKANLDEGVIYIEGDINTSIVDADNKISTWTGSTERITTLKDGIAIRYKIPVEGNTTTKLKLTYGPRGYQTEVSKTIYRFSSTKLSTQFPVGSIITLIYHADLNDGCWMTNDYDSNTNTQARNYNSKSTTYNLEYPLTARYNIDSTAVGKYKAEYGRFTPDVTLNPYTGTITATYFSGDGSNLTSLNASNVSSGTLPVARLAASGATAGTYGPNNDSNLTGSESFMVPAIQVDTYGRVTSIENRILTLPGDMYHSPKYSSGLLIGTNEYADLYVPTGTTANTVALGNHSHDDRYSLIGHNHEGVYAPINQLQNYIPLSQKGVANGVATLDTNGLVPSSQLPSYVDDVLEGYLSGDGTYFYYLNDKSEVRYTGETGKIYVDISTHKCYRYSGSTYVEIISSISLSAETPKDVGNLAAAGISNTAARADHSHKLSISDLKSSPNGTYSNAFLTSDGLVCKMEGSYIWTNGSSYYLSVGYSSNDEGKSKLGGITLHSGSKGSNNYINLVASNNTGSLKTITLPSVSGTVITTGNLNNITYINGGTI